MFTFVTDKVAETPKDYRDCDFYGDVKLWQFNCYLLTVRQTNWLLHQHGIECSMPENSYCCVTMYKGRPWLLSVTADYSVEIDLIEQKLRYRTDMRWSEWL